MTPTSPGKPCAWSGCPEIVHRATHCPRHAKRDEEERRAVYERDRPTATARGYGATHRRWRRMVLSRHPLCICRMPDCTHPAGECHAPSTEADHVNGNVYDRRLENGAGLCKPCHSRKTVRDQGGWAPRAAAGGRGDQSL